MLLKLHSEWQAHNYIVQFIFKQEQFTLFLSNMKHIM